MEQVDFPIQAILGSKTFLLSFLDVQHHKHRPKNSVKDESRRNIIPTYNYHDLMTTHFFKKSGIESSVGWNALTGENPKFNWNGSEYIQDIQRSFPTKKHNMLASFDKHDFNEGTGIRLLAKKSDIGGGLKGLNHADIRKRLMSKKSDIEAAVKGLEEASAQKNKRGKFHVNKVLAIFGFAFIKQSSPFWKSPSSFSLSLASCEYSEFLSALSELLGLWYMQAILSG